jgi:hypothetical protein
MVETLLSHVRSGSRSSVVVAILAACIALCAVLPSQADTWRGTAPFCKGRCLGNERQLARNKDGNGGHCVTGHKVLCQNPQPLCRGVQTRTSCAALVLICDNGFYSTPDVWHSCQKYACGACFGN